MYNVDFFISYMTIVKKFQFADFKFQIRYNISQVCTQKFLIHKQDIVKTLQPVKFHLLKQS